MFRGKAHLFVASVFHRISSKRTIYKCSAAPKATRGKKHSAIFISFMLIALGTVMGLGIAEVVLRLVGYKGNENRMNTVYLPALGTVRKDSWILDYVNNAKNSSQVNIRNQVIPLKKQEGETRVLFIGDSGTEAPYLPIEESYPLVFKRFLDEKKPDNRVRVINAGVWGMTTIDEYHFFKEELMRLDPDIVVLGLFMANDINFNLGHSRRRIEQTPTYDWVAMLKDRSALIHFLYLSLLSLNHEYQLFSSDRVGTTSFVHLDLALVDSNGFHMLNYPVGELATYMKKSSALIDEAFDILHTMLYKFHKLASDNGFKFRVVLIPTPSAVAQRLAILHHPDLLSDLDAQGIRVKESDLDFQKPRRRVMQICEQLDISCLDPTHVMQRIGLSVFFPQDEHLTKLGHEVLARELVTY